MKAKELDLVRKALRRYPIVTITGTVGMGKTSMLLALANTFKGDEWSTQFVSGSSIGSWDAMRRQIDSKPVRPGQKPLLMLLDDAHLVNASITAMLVNYARQHDAHLIAASRRPLGIEGAELVVPLRALSPQQSNELLASLSSAWPLNERTLEAIKRIAQTTQGHPLALVLIAGALRNRSPETILDALNSAYEGIGTHPVLPTKPVDLSHLSALEMGLLMAMTDWDGAVSADDAVTRVEGDIPPQADVSAALLRLAQKRLLARTVVDGRELYLMTRAIMNELSAWKRQQELLPLALALAAT